ncbi:MAG: hypothetical protein V3W34_06130 [Phycisphaerae bacterium]
MIHHSASPIGRRAAAVILAVSAVGMHANAAEVTLWTGVAGDGSLTVVVDDYGSFGHGFKAPDWFQVQDMDPQGRTAATTIFLFIDPSTVGNGTHRGVFSGHGGYIDTYDDGNLVFEVKQENSTDNLPTSTDSVINVFGAGGVFLQVTLTQTVSELGPGPNGEVRAQLEQTYCFTNTGGSTREWIIVKHIDVDDGGGFDLDVQVGADFAELGRPQVYVQDRKLTNAALVLRTRDNHDPRFADEFGVVPNSIDFVYYATKQSIRPRGNPEYPGGSCPAYGFGTDFFIWDNYGAPNCWKNNVPRVGYDVPGISPQLSGDASLGLQVEAALEPGKSYEVAFVTLYVQRVERLFGDGDGDGDRDIYDFEIYLACVGNYTDTDAPGICHLFDDENDNDVDLHDFAAFQRVYAR